jgi:hypothetical protein
MSWLDDQIAKREDLQTREMWFGEHAPKVYGDLWNRLIKIIEEAKTKPELLGQPIFSSGGSNGERKIEAAFANATGSRVLFFALSQDYRTITATMPGGSLVFEIYVCGNGVFCLKQGGEVIGPQDAAHAIMGTFLFPELHRKP